MTHAVHTKSSKKTNGILLYFTERNVCASRRAMELFRNTCAMSTNLLSYLPICCKVDNWLLNAQQRKIFHAYQGEKKGNKYVFTENANTNILV